MASVNDVQIRAAGEADVPLLFDLILELAAYEKLGDKIGGDAEVLRRSLFEERAAEALLLETTDGEAVGYAIFFTTFSTFECRSGIWLEDVYVRPEHRRGGIGRALMEHLAELAQERGHVRLEWVALDWNEPPSTSTPSSERGASTTGRSSASSGTASPVLPTAPTNNRCGFPLNHCGFAFAAVDHPAVLLLGRL